MSEWDQKNAELHRQIELLEQELKRQAIDHVQLVSDIRSGRTYLKAREDVLQKRNADLEVQLKTVLRANERLLSDVGNAQDRCPDAEHVYFQEQRDDDRRCPKCGSLEISPSDYDAGDNGIGIQCGSCGYDSEFLETSNRPFILPGDAGSKDNLEGYDPFPAGHESIDAIRG